MTTEQAFYFKIMLICGYSDELYEYIEKALNEQNTYEDVIVDLAFCGYNEKQMLSVLEAYIRQQKDKIDYNVFIDSIFTFLQNKYPDNNASLKSYVKLMYDMSISLQEYNDDPCSEPRFTMAIFDEFYEDAEKGYIDKEEYLEYMKSFIFERKHYNEFQFYKPVIQQSRIKIYLQNLINKIKLWKGRYL